MEEMTSLERTMATIEHRIPDRVPVDLHNFLSTIHFAGYDFSEALQDGEMMAEAQLGYWREFAHDVLLIENGVCAEAEAVGCEVEYLRDGAPRVVRHVLAEGLEKIEELEVPDPYTTHPLKEVLKATRIVAQQIGDKVFVMGRADQGPLALAAALRGYDQILIDIALGQQTELIHRLLDFCTQVQTHYALALREQGAHGTSLGEYGPQISSPRIYREHTFSYDKRFIEDLKGFPVALHICGNATPILEDMVATGAAILELDHMTDMRVAKNVMRGKATFLGPINPAETLWRGTPALVEEQAREAIEILAPGGGLILGPGCAMAPDTPAENVHALIEAARKYGRYRPDGSLIA